MTLIKTRFAPSPTGKLHVGNVRTALVNWLFARANNGIFMLRMDDTDLARSKSEFEESIKSDLNWLGLHWNEFARQSERMQRYNEIKEKLISLGRLYPCFETQADLEMKRKMLLSRGLPPIYDRSGLKLTPEQKLELINSGTKPHYRFKLYDELIEWNDLIRGPIQFKAENLSDPIVIREDGTMTYILCSAIDDIDFAITHILRGEDHISNTAIGIQITKALGQNPPEIGHTSLLQSKSGEISKRLGGFDIESLRDKYIHPMAINSLLAKIGTSDPSLACNDMRQLIDEFDTNKFNSAAVNYEFNDLLHINHKLINLLSYQEVEEQLEKFSTKIPEAFWQATKGNINTVAEIEHWWKICKDPIDYINQEESKEFLAITATFLPDGDWDNQTWDIWITRVKAATNKNGKDLFMPIRLALTGKNSGPELKYLLPFIGRNEAIHRLTGNAAL